MQPNSQLVLSMAGFCDVCQNDNPSLPGPSSVSLPLSIVSQPPYTDGVYTVGYLPTIAGSFTASVQLMTQGGLLATYYRSMNFSDADTSTAVLASLAHLDGEHHGPGWCDGLQFGKYFNDWSQTLPVSSTPSGKSNLTFGCDSTRLDHSLSFDWGEDSPLPFDNFPSNEFGVQWKGFLKAPATGLYVFSVSSDYGASMSFNGTKYLSGIPLTSKIQSFKAYLRSEVFLPVDIRYYHRTGQASFIVAWTGPGLNGTVPLNGSNLYFSREIANSPTTVQVYPGDVDSKMTTAVGPGLSECSSQQTCSFIIQSKDTFGNNIFNSGDLAWNISIIGIRGFNSNEIPIVPAVVTPLNWVLLGLVNVDTHSNVVRTSMDFTSLIKRGDSVVIGSEVLTVSTSILAAFNATSLPLARPYLGRSTEGKGIRMYKLPVNCSSGKYLVEYTPTVSGIYSLHVQTMAMEQVQQVEIFADDFSLSGFYSLEVAVSDEVEGQLIKTSTPVLLSTGFSSLSAADVATKAALDALLILATVKVTHSRCDSSYCAFQITFIGMNQNLPLVTVDRNGITGNGIRVSVTEAQAGALAQDILQSPFELSVVPGLADAALSWAAGPGLSSCNTGDVATFVIQSKDAWGNNRTDSQARDVFSVHAFIPEDDATDSRISFEGSVTYAQDGAYSVQLNPVVQGTYSVIVVLATTFEVQNITISWVSKENRDASGTFSLSYGDCGVGSRSSVSISSAPLTVCSSASSLRWNSSSADIIAALGTLPGVGEVNVSQSVAAGRHALSVTWLVTFLSACDKGDLAIKAASSASGIYSATTVQQGVCSHISAHDTASMSAHSMPLAKISSKYSYSIRLVGERQYIKVVCPNSAPSCSFRIAFRGFTSAVTRSSGLSAAGLATLLQSLPTVGSVNVTMTSLSNLYSTITAYTVEFRPWEGSTSAHIENFGPLPLLRLNITGISTAIDMSPGQSAVTRLARGSAPFVGLNVHAVSIHAASTTADYTASGEH